MSPSMCSAQLLMPNGVWLCFDSVCPPLRLLSHTYKIRPASEWTRFRITYAWRLNKLVPSATHTHPAYIDGGVPPWTGPDRAERSKGGRLINRRPAGWHVFWRLAMQKLAFVWRTTRISISLLVCVCVLEERGIIVSGFVWEGVRLQCRINYVLPSFTSGGFGFVPPGWAVESVDSAVESVLGIVIPFRQSVCFTRRERTKGFY